jgi:hypothetical protein
MGLLLLAAGGAVAAAGCGQTCVTGASQCSDDHTLQFCANRGTNLSPNASGNFWTTNACEGANPFCVSLSSGAATCAATPTRVCDGGTYVCLGNAPGFCDDGYVQSSPTACSPETVCTPAAGGATCNPPQGSVISEAGAPDAATVDAGDAGGEGPDASDAAPVDAAPDGETPDL